MPRTTTGRTIKAGYDAKAVAAYVREQIETGEPTRANSRPVEYLNKRRMSAEDQRRVDDWATSRDRAELSAVDRFLMRHDLQLWEFEHWAEQHVGSSTFFDITAP